MKQATHYQTFAETPACGIGAFAPGGWDRRMTTRRRGKGSVDCKNCLRTDVCQRGNTAVLLDRVGMITG